MNSISQIALSYVVCYFLCERNFKCIYVLCLQPMMMCAYINCTCSIALFAEQYRAHLHPVYFRNELRDVVFFSGNIIQLDCEANCEPHCISDYKVLHNGNFIYGSRFNFIEQQGKFRVNIINASIDDAGIYQCKKDVWPRGSHIVGREANVQLAGKHGTYYSLYMEYLFTSRQLYFT